MFKVKQKRIGIEFIFRFYNKKKYCLFHAHTNNVLTGLIEITQSAKIEKKKTVGIIEM